MGNTQLNISHIYSSNPLDRGNRKRRDEQWITDMAKDRTSKFLPMKDLNVLVSEGQQNSLGWLGVDDMLQLRIDTGALFLGLLKRVACFVVDITDHEYAVRQICDSGSYRFVDARTATSFLSNTNSGIVAQARSQVSWHNQNRFCSICGHLTIIKHGGQVRQSGFGGRVTEGGSGESAGNGRSRSGVAGRPTVRGCAALADGPRDGSGCVGRGAPVSRSGAARARFGLGG